MAIDPEIASFLEGPDDSDMNDIIASRAVGRLLAEQREAAREPLAHDVKVHDESLIDSSGREVPVRIYRRDGVTTPSGALLFIHGGAFIFGDLDSEHDRCLHYVQHADVLVVSVDYRLAPENPYPAGLDDCWSALTWVLAHCEQLGVDPARVGVAGASAGGALAAGLALRCRDEGVDLAAQMLIYPVLDDRATTASMVVFEDYIPWDGRRTRQMWPLYLGHGRDAVPYAAPARADDLSGLPTTYLMSCEEDPLRDEEFEYATRLLAAGVSVEFHQYRATYHAFDVIAPGTSLSREALDEHARFLQRVLAPTLR